MKLFSKSISGQAVNPRFIKCLIFLHENDHSHHFLKVYIKTIVKFVFSIWICIKTSVKYSKVITEYVYEIQVLNCPLYRYVNLNTATLFVASHASRAFHRVMLLLSLRRVRWPRRSWKKWRLVLRFAVRPLSLASVRVDRLT